MKKDKENLSIKQRYTERWDRQRGKQTERKKRQAHARKRDKQLGRQTNGELENS